MGVNVLDLVSGRTESYASIWDYVEDAKGRFEYADAHTELDLLARRYGHDSTEDLQEYLAIEIREN